MISILFTILLGFGPVEVTFEYDGQNIQVTYSDLTVSSTEIHTVEWVDTTYKFDYQCQCPSDKIDIVTFKTPTDLFMLKEHELVQQGIADRKVLIFRN